jgi:hypothetical protein
MGIERARVVEVHAPTSPGGAVGSGYVVGDRLVLTAGRVAGRNGPTHIRPAGTATWIPASPVLAGSVCVLEVEDPSELMLSPDPGAFGRITGTRPLAVTAMGFAASPTRPDWPRDPRQLLGHVTPGDPLRVTTIVADDGMCGAALFAGAELVGVLLSPAQAAPVAPLVDVFAGVELTDVSPPAFGLPIL